MPKLVDHTERRDRIAAAVREVLLRDGLDAVTVRALVAETGMSSGSIRHYFDNHADLLRFALAGIIDRVADRVQSVLTSEDPPRVRAQRLLEQFLPLDAERRMELDATMALARLDATREQIERIRAALAASARAAVLLLTGRTGPFGQPLESSLEQISERLRLLVDGIAAQELLYPGMQTPADLRAMLTAALDDTAAAIGDS